LSEALSVGPGDVIAFWRDAGPEKWFKKDLEFDRSISARFSGLHAEVAADRKRDWAATAEGALGLILLLDQFSRNMFRGTPNAFAQDEAANRIARQSLDAKFDKAVAPELRFFFYLPFMHAERIADQERCILLFHSISPDNLRFAREHEAIIRRFGRFPHRNAILGRHTTPAEQIFLDSGGFAG
jgi:uncharacterized protein (DUF924 family)